MTDKHDNAVTTSSNSKITKTAGVIIIGDEILKGHTVDRNSPFILGRLWKLGVKVEKVSFIGDNVIEIADEVNNFSERFSIVLTSGGIGPTHDDITFEGIAKAFNEPLHENAQLMDIIKELMKRSNTSMTPGIQKMACIPESGQIIVGTDKFTKKPASYPLIMCHNVYVFPGVPDYLQTSFHLNEQLFSSDGGSFFLTKIYISASESTISSLLDEVNAKFKDRVHIGSYPILDNTYKVKLTLESSNEHNLDLCYKSLMSLLPADILVSVHRCMPNSRNEDAEVHVADHEKEAMRLFSTSFFLPSLMVSQLDEYLSDSATSSISAAIKCAWAVIKQATESYPPNEVCIGFNGGKDCTAVLHLWVAYNNKICPDRMHNLTGLHFQTGSPFPEITQFIEDCKSSYGLNMISFTGSIQEGMRELRKQHPHIKAIIMGTRHGDPYSAQLRAFAMTDPHWPQFMRVFPILDWSYVEVWEFLRMFELPYCPLYDEGYTSLGLKENTAKNLKLLMPDGQYSPAYTLIDEGAERTGRH